MKTPFAPLALAAAASFAPPASAQSGVTLSGIADAGVRWVGNDGVASAKSMVSGSNATSRIILRGTEDLGAGLSAGFHLEHGLILTNGAQASSTVGQFWDRRATVSLTSRSLGEVRAGRDFVPSYSNWSVFDPFSYVGAAGANNLISATPQGPIRAAFGTNPNTTVRAPSERDSRAISSGTFSSLDGRYITWRTREVVTVSVSTTTFSGSFMCS